MIVGIGLDLVEIARIERLLDGKGARALARLFTPREVTYAKARARPAMHLAARLAAKEAAFKALAGTSDARLIGWRDVEVVARRGQGPRLAFHGRAARRVKQLAVHTAFVTLTHTETTAAAVVILSTR